MRRSGSTLACSTRPRAHRRRRPLLRQRRSPRRAPARVGQALPDHPRAPAGPSEPEVADRVACHPNSCTSGCTARGFTIFKQPSNPKGRPPIITGHQVCEFIDIALSSPAESGSPSTVAAAACCLRSPTSVRRRLRREGLRSQRIRTWKISRDPEIDWERSTRRVRRCNCTKSTSASLLAPLAGERG